MAAKEDFPAETIATLLGVGVRRLQQLAQQGYIPHGAERGTYPLVGSVRGYCKFLQEHGSASGRGSEHSRLARAQAVKVEMENYRRAGAHVLHADAMELMTRLATELNSGLDAVPSRCANDLASIDDPALIRQRLQDEHHDVRQRLADGIAEFAKHCQLRADDLENAPPEEKADAESVGGGEPDDATGFAAAGSL